MTIIKKKKKAILANGVNVTPKARDKTMKKTKMTVMIVIRHYIYRYVYNIKIKLIKRLLANRQRQ